MARSVFVHESHSFTVPAERVFDAWLTPAQAGRFLFVSRTGVVMHCEIDPQVGGTFTVTDRRPNPDGDESFFEAQHRGRYVEIDRPRRLVFDFSVEPFSDRTTRVSIDITPSGGGCELMLTHDLGEGDEALAYAERTRRGWSAMLRQLEKVVTTRLWGLRAPGTA
ncbi:SRPBCC domain-containing protein [Ramlibacter sp.]|uniref:SRPBCC family protein n=1 Tax=Ramlibacter sp. TaxID=1917967 RepID=UPI002CBCEE56|nr:SRPBCC domain-containing protein [Ramlibacter sp.]HWI83507.1 SRPBCC domain-containing protein [Ramlibacter sp.]